MYTYQDKAGQNKKKHKTTVHKPVTLTFNSLEDFKLRPLFRKRLVEDPHDVDVDFHPFQSPDEDIIRVFPPPPLSPANSVDEDVGFIHARHLRLDGLTVGAIKNLFCFKTSKVATRVA